MNGWCVAEIAHSLKAPSRSRPLSEIPHSLTAFARSVVLAQRPRVPFGHPRAARPFQSRPTQFVETSATSFGCRHSFDHTPPQPTRSLLRLTAHFVRRSPSRCSLRSPAAEPPVRMRDLRSLSGRTSHHSLTRPSRASHSLRSFPHAPKLAPSRAVLCGGGGRARNARGPRERPKGVTEAAGEDEAAVRCGP